MPAALKAARATGAQVNHVQWELFLYGSAALAGLLPAYGRAGLRPSSTPIVTTLHQVVQPAAVDRSHTRLHRLAIPATAAWVALARVWLDTDMLGGCRPGEPLTS
jgi:hypothetical protein